MSKRKLLEIYVLKIITISRTDKPRINETSRNVVYFPKRKNLEMILFEMYVSKPSVLHIIFKSIIVSGNLYFDDFPSAEKTFFHNIYF